MSSALNATSVGDSCTIFEEGPNYVEILPHGDSVKFSLNATSTVNGLTVNIQGYDKIKVLNNYFFLIYF